MSKLFPKQQSDSPLDNMNSLSPKPSKKQLRRFLSNSSKKRHKSDLNVYGEAYSFRMSKLKERSADGRSTKLDRKPKSHEQHNKPLKEELILPDIRQHREVNICRVSKGNFVFTYKAT